MKVKMNGGPVNEVQVLVTPVQLATFWIGLDRLGSKEETGAYTGTNDLHLQPELYLLTVK